jgi:hypothetical protein
MSDPELNPIDFARAEEQLKQERETFQLYKAQSARWFLLRLSVGYTSVLALVVILGVCTYILMNATIFPVSVTTAAGAALFGDVVGVVATIWKVVLSPGTVASLTPVTRAPPRSRVGQGIDKTRRVPEAAPNAVGVTDVPSS